MKLWKVLGVAGMAGVAATGVIIARDQRRRAQLTPDQVRKQLHQRLSDLDRGPAAVGEPAPAVSTSVPTKPGGSRRRWRG